MSVPSAILTQVMYVSQFDQKTTAKVYLLTSYHQSTNEEDEKYRPNDCYVYCLGTTRRIEYGEKVDTNISFRTRIFLITRITKFIPALKTRNLY